MICLGIRVVSLLGKGLLSLVGSLVCVLDSEIPEFGSEAVMGKNLGGFGSDYWYSCLRLSRLAHHITLQMSVREKFGLRILMSQALLE